MKKIANVGVDYHLNSLSIAVLPEGERDFYKTIHSEEEESMRSLIRCRLAFKEDAKRTKHRINSFLLDRVAFSNCSRSSFFMATPYGFD